MENEMEAWGVTADGCGHLYVSDWANECIQMFTIDGDYLGPVLKKGEQGLGTPGRILWFIIFCRGS